MGTSQKRKAEWPVNLQRTVQLYQCSRKWRKKQILNTTKIQLHTCHIGKCLKSDNIKYWPGCVITGILVGGNINWNRALHKHFDIKW